MKLSTLLVLSLPFVVSGRRVFDMNKFKSELGGVELDKRSKFEQLIINPLFSEPKKQEFLIPDGEQPQDGPTLLTSTISTHRQISLFASYVRDNIEMSNKFNSKNSLSIVFAPTDLAIQSLDLKPWQFPNPLSSEATEEELDTIISSNTNDFVLSHVIDGEVPFKALTDTKKGVQLVTENNKIVKLVNDNGDYYVAAVNTGFPENWIKVESIVEVDNGVLLIIDQSLSIPHTE